MSNELEIELDGQGIRNLLKSDEIENELKSHAKRIIKSCSGNYEITEYEGPSRKRVSIITHDAETFHRNLKDNELLMNLRG